MPPAVPVNAPVYIAIENVLFIITTKVSFFMLDRSLIIELHKQCLYNLDVQRDKIEHGRWCSYNI